MKRDYVAGGPGRRAGVGFAMTLALALLSIASKSGAREASELVGQVEIRRTSYGVPHIKGETLEAAAFGLAYCQAEDHLPTIMKLILTARGELAANFGDEGRNVESDFWNRQYRVRARAVETYHKLDADFRSMLEGYATGINYYIELHREELAEWIQPIGPHDVAAHGMTGVMRFAFNRRNIIRSFLREQGSESAMTAGSDDTMGSNMWAFGPERTKSGHAILMGNPHQAWSEVATYYEAHLTVPGKLNFYGSTFIGRPVLTTGFNDNLGWSHTVNYPDLEEIYELTLDPERADHYLFDGGSVALRRENVSVEVKTSEGVERLERTFWQSPLGPVIHRTQDKVYVLKSAVYDEFRFYQHWLRLAQSRNYEDFREALNLLAIPMFNICYADREGNIFYLWNGTVPDIPHKAQTSKAVPAARSADVWTQYHAIDELPQLFNPKGGYVQNSNDPPYFTNLHEPLDRKSYPAHFPDQRLGLRTQHSLQLIHDTGKFSLEEIVDMKFSQRMLLADRVKDDLIDALKQTSPEGELAAAIEMLERWDNSVSAESRGSVAFETWWGRYARQGRRMRADAFEVPWSPEHPVTTPRGLGNRERAAEAFRWALTETRKNYGSWDVAWGEVHRVRSGDVDLPVGGGSGAIGAFRVLSFRKAEDGKQVVSGGDSWIFTVEFGETPRAYTVVGYSQSEMEDSPHLNDQAALYAANKMKKAAFTEEEIARDLLVAYRPGEEKK